MRMCGYALLSLLLAGEVNAQSAIERHAWQDAGSFRPVSTTASAITGTISLSGNPVFASKGSKMTLSFQDGRDVGLISEGGYWREWELGSESKQTAEIFRLERDPGILRQGNTLCANKVQDQSIYVVFHEGSLSGGAITLNAAFFQSREPPYNINSSGLCGTFSYVIEQEIELSPFKDQARESAAGNWTLKTDINPFDDSKVVILATIAEEGSSSRGEPISFIARCKSNKTEVYVDWHDYLGDDSHDVYSDWKDVIVRVGQGEARVERWGTSTDQESTFAPSWSGTFLKELLEHQRLVLQTTPYGENPSTAIFNVSGLRNVLGDLAEACNWKF